MKTEMPKELKAIALMMAASKSDETMKESWEFAKKKNNEVLEQKNVEATPLEKLLKAYEAFVFAVGQTVIEVLERDKLIVVSPVLRDKAAFKIATSSPVMCGIGFVISEIVEALEQERNLKHKE